MIIFYRYKHNINIIILFQMNNYSNISNLCAHFLENWIEKQLTELYLLSYTDSNYNIISISISNTDTVWVLLKGLGK